MNAVDCIEELAYNLSSVVKTETRGMNWDQWDQADMELKPDNWRTEYFDAKGRVAVPNRMNFRENSNTAFDPPRFRKIMLQILYHGYGCIYARRYDGTLFCHSFAHFFWHYSFYF